MHGTVAAAARIYLVGIVWFAVLVGTAIAYIGLIDIAFAALGVDPVLASLFTLAVAATSASAVAWLLWSTLRPREERAVRVAMAPRESARTSLLANRSSGR